MHSRGSGDQKIQAYNFRICLTDSVENRIPITRPRYYDSTKYELLVRLFMAQPEMRKINDYFIWSRMPHRKTDINNRGGFSTDMIGMNYEYPEATYKKRERIFDQHLSYTKGLFIFYENRSESAGEPADLYVRLGGIVRMSSESLGILPLPVIYQGSPPDDWRIRDD